MDECDGITVNMNLDEKSSFMKEKLIECGKKKH